MLSARVEGQGLVKSQGAGVAEFTSGGGRGSGESSVRALWRALYVGEQWTKPREDLNPVNSAWTAEWQRRRVQAVLGRNG